MKKSKGRREREKGPHGLALESTSSGHAGILGFENLKGTAVARVPVCSFRQGVYVCAGG